LRPFVKTVPFFGGKSDAIKRPPGGQCYDFSYFFAGKKWLRCFHFFSPKIGENSRKSDHNIDPGTINLTFSLSFCMYSHPGTDNMILKIFSPQNVAKKLAFLTKNKAKLCKNLIITLVF
jgi:hypothetical protein